MSEEAAFKRRDKLELDRVLRDIKYSIESMQTRINTIEQRIKNIERSKQKSNLEV